MFTNLCFLSGVSCWQHYQKPSLYSYPEILLLGWGSGLGNYDCTSYALLKKIPGSTLNIWLFDGIAADSNYLAIVEDASTQAMPVNQSIVLLKNSTGILPIDP